MCVMNAPQRLASAVYALLLALTPGLADEWTPQRYKAVFPGDGESGPYVSGRSFDLVDYPHLDGQWKGLLHAGDGNVYFSVGSHASEHHAEIFRYLGGEGRIEHLADLGDVVEATEPPGAPQDKVHTAMFEYNGWIYAATCDGPRHDGLEYHGGHWIAIDMKTGDVRDLGRTETGDGIITAGFDSIRGILYGHTNRLGRLLRFDPESSEEEDLGFPWEGVGRQYARGMSLMVAPDGRVFGGRPPGATFWEWSPATGKIRVLDASMPEPAEIAAEDADDRTRRNYAQSAIHVTRWNEDGGYFYFVRSFDEMLGRFYPGGGGTEPRAEALGRLRPPHLGYRYADRHAACTLAVHGNRVYYTPYTGWGGVTHLVRFDLDEGRLTDLGPLILEDGRRVAEVHAMDIDEAGRLYMLAFAYNIEGEDPLNRHATRDGYAFHPRFVVVDPETALRRVPREASGQ